MDYLRMLYIPTVRFCSLLGFSEEEVSNAVVLKFVQSCKLEVVKKMCR